MNRKTAILAALLSGLSLASAATAAPPQAALVERGAEQQLTVSWTSPVPVDVYVAEAPGAPLAKARLISPHDADGKETVAAAGPARSYFILRNTRTGETTRVAERVVPLQAGSNFRDLGGYPAANGKHVRWGMIYRSGGTPLLNAADLATVDGLGLAQLFDLRSDEERQLAPSRIDGVAYSSYGYSMAKAGLTGGDMQTVYRSFPMMLAPQAKLVFASLLRGAQPLAFNCSAGQDRTGFVSALILSSLGVPRDVIIADYHLSTRYRRPEFEMPRLDPALYPDNAVAQMFAKYQGDPRMAQPYPLKTADGTAFLSFAFAEIDAKWGSVDNYLRDALGLSPKDIAQLRRMYTE